MGYVDVPKHITHVKFHPSVTEVHDEAFKDCTKLKEVVFSDGITKIGNRSFKGCTKLKRVVFNNGLKQIGHDAFANCSSLDSVTFPSTITKIGDRAFKECSSFKELTRTRSGSDQSQTVGWDVYHGCPLEKYKVRLDKIVHLGHMKKLEKMIDETGTTIEIKDGYITVPITDHLILPPRKTLDKIGNLMQYYEVKEATTLIELALWNAKLSEAGEEVISNRHACRVEVPGPAKDLILEYAYRIPMHTTTYIQIYINCSRGVFLLQPYDVEPSDTIADFKKKILDNKGIPVDQQKLSFHGELLNDSNIISKCNIQMDSIIDLVVIGD